MTMVKNATIMMILLYCNHLVLAFMVQMMKAKNLRIALEYGGMITGQMGRIQKYA